MSTSTADPLEVAVSVSRTLAVHLVKTLGAVPPFGIAFLGPDSSPQTYFPRDKHPRLEWGALVDMVVATLRERVNAGNVFVTAIVSEVQSSDGAQGFAAQIESATGISLLIYPYKVLPNEVEVDEPKYDERLVMFSGTFPLPPQ